MPKERRKLSRSSALFIKYTIFFQAILFIVLAVKIFIGLHYAFGIVVLIIGILLMFPFWNLKYIEYDNDKIFITDVFQKEVVKLEQVCRLEESFVSYLYSLKYTNNKGRKRLISIWPKHKVMFGMFSSDPIPDSIKEFLHLLNRRQ